MQVEELGTISTDTNTDFEIDVGGYVSHPEAVLQVNITGTITIQVLGSLDGNAYVEILEASSVDQLAAIAMVPFLRITSTGTSGGTAVITLGRNGVV